MARGQCSSTDGFKIIMLFRDICYGGIDAAIYAICHPVVQKGNVRVPSRSADEILEPLASHLTRVTSLWVEAIRGASSAGAEDNQNRDVQLTLLRMRILAKDQWYQELKVWGTPMEELRSSAQYQRLVLAWVSLGEALGLDENTERILFDAERARLCSWRSCAHHREPAEKTLSICKGCKEARYCSRECQTRYGDKMHFCMSVV